jgi:hypothetical protein
MPARAPPVTLDLDAARRFIAVIMGKRAPTEREVDALLTDWLEQEGIPNTSPRAVAIRSHLVPGISQEQAQVASRLRPELRRHAAMLMRLATEHKTTVARIEEMLERRGLLAIARTLPAEQLEGQVLIQLKYEELQAAVAHYPRNEAGTLMRSIASNMATKSGNSIEEIARAGVFVYADFKGSQFLRATSGRNPDDRSMAMVFYVTRVDGKWRFDGYRQNRITSLTDPQLVTEIKQWLNSGGIPAGDLR